MKKSIALVIISSLLLSSCSVFATPSPTPDVQATVQVAAQTGVAETLTAMPTNTPLPTATMVPPTATVTPTEIIIPTATIDPASLFSPTPWEGTLVPGGFDGIHTARLLIVNNSGIKGVVVTLTGSIQTTEQPYYGSWVVDGSQLVIIPYATFNVTVQIPNKATFTGGWRQYNKDKTTLVITLKKGIQVLGP